jgi:hypothetical protein
MSEFVIETRGLRKTFDGRAAVDGLDLQFPREAFLDSSAGMAQERPQPFDFCLAF